MKLARIPLSQAVLAMLGLMIVVFIALLRGGPFLNGVFGRENRLSTEERLPASTRQESAPAAASEPGENVRFTFRAGAYSDADNATRVAECLGKLGLHPLRRQFIDKDRQLWHVVSLGPYRDWDAASQAASSIRTHCGLTPAIAWK